MVGPLAQQQATRTKNRRKNLGVRYPGELRRAAASVEGAAAWGDFLQAHTRKGGEKIDRRRRRSTAPLTEVGVGPPPHHAYDSAGDERRGWVPEVSGLKIFTGEA